MLMVEQKLAMASTSAANQNPLPMKEALANYYPYPPPLANYEDVINNPQLFMETLEKLHATMGTKFMIPVIGGKDLDLHRLFVEVTTRGGIEKIIRERRWKEVTAIFNFPSSATNASFILRKYYFSLLHHYERIHYFKAKGWTPMSTDVLQNVATALAPPHGLTKPVVQSPENQAAAQQPKRMKPAAPSSGVAVGASATSTGIPVTGVIDGKFESGYLITVSIGSEKLKGVLYQCLPNPAHQVPQQLNVAQCHSVTPNNGGNSTAAPGVLRHRRRKKCEIKKRDPDHPKPNRSGYNFFFAEQHARLKQLYSGKDREISRMIGERWNKLKESDKVVYQDKAIKDKERYRIEMESYKERLRSGQIISDAVPIQQRPLQPDIAMQMVQKIETEVLESSHSQESESSSGKSDRSSLEDDQMADRDSDMAISDGAETGGPNRDMETSNDEEAAELQKGADLTGKEGDECLVETNIESLAFDDKRSLPIEEKEAMSVADEKESVIAEEQLVSSKADKLVPSEGGQ